MATIKFSEEDIAKWQAHYATLSLVELKVERDALQAHADSLDASVVAFEALGDVDMADKALMVCGVARLMVHEVEHALARRMACEDALLDATVNPLTEFKEA